MVSSPALRYSCQSDCMSSGFAATVREYGLRRPIPQGTEREQAEPERQRRGGERDHDEAGLVAGGFGGRGGDACEREREDEEERAHRAPLPGWSHFRMLRRSLATPHKRSPDSLGRPLIPTRRSGVRALRENLGK